MASGVSPVLRIGKDEGYQLRRHRSRIYYESDYTSPTSWEYRELHMPAGSPLDGNGSFCHVIGNNIILSPKVSDNNACNGSGHDGSRNSSGSSSTSSQRSHDSGFSDSGETKARANIETAKNHDNCNSNGSIKDNGSSSFTFRVASEGTIVTSPCPCNNNSPYQEIILAHPCSPTTCRITGNNNEVFSYCSTPVKMDNGCIAHESFRSFTPNHASELGFPISCSTPKHNRYESKASLHSMSNRPSSSNIHNKKVIIEKIDNLQTLNKNEKLDSNNNSSGGGNKSNNNSSFNLKSNDSSGNANSSKTMKKSSKTGLKKLMSRASSSSNDSSIGVLCPNNAVNKSSLSSGVRPETTCGSTIFLSPDLDNTSMMNGTVLRKIPCNIIQEERDEFEVRVPYEASLTLPHAKEEYSPWVSLPRGFKRVEADSRNTAYADHHNKVIIKTHYDNESMRHWLHELRGQVESETLFSLQNKAIPQPQKKACESHSSYASSYANDSSSYRSGVRAISHPLMSIRNVEKMANLISIEFSKICKCIEFSWLTQVPSLVITMTDLISQFLSAFQNSSPSTQSGHLNKLERHLDSTCSEVRQSVDSMDEVLCAETSESNYYSVIQEPGHRDCHVIVSEVIDGIIKVGNLFSQVVDFRLTRDLSYILENIEGHGIVNKVALRSLTFLLADGGNHLCRLASQVCTVRGLLRVLMDYKKDENDKIMALRSLATILCVPDAVRDFDRAGGFEILADYLYDPQLSLEIKTEAMAVFAQATDPWLDLETALGNLGLHLEKTVVALTNLIKPSKWNEEHFLLLVASLSNLTFLEMASIKMLHHYRTMPMIIDVIIKNSNYSIFVLDHVATILANMSGIETCREELVQANSVILLLKLLKKIPCLAGNSQQEIAAYERVQQKSTVALSRLSSEQGVAQMVFKSGGLHRLVQLCKNEKERNYSDGVLVAAIATLRKMVEMCGVESRKELQADDLITPRLLDSFLMYSTRQESYV